MRPQRIHLIPNDWQHLEVELNHLTKWISSQATTPLSSPTFIGLTLTGLTAGRIPVVTAGGLIADSPYFLWDNDYGELHLKSTTAICFGEDSESLIYHNGHYMRIIDDDSIHLDAPAIVTAGTLGAGAITGTSFIIGANTISSFTNLASLAGLTYASTSFVKMTAAGTFGLDTTTYLSEETDPVFVASYAHGITGVDDTTIENTAGVLNVKSGVFQAAGSYYQAGDSPSFVIASLSSQLKILEGGATPTKYSIFQGGDQTVDLTYTLPTALGAAGTVLTDAAGDGVLSWAAGGGGTSDHAALTHLAYADSGHTGFQATHASLTDLIGLAVTDGNIIVGDGANWVAESGATARTSLGLGTGDSPTFKGFTVSSSTELALFSVIGDGYGAQGKFATYRDTGFGGIFSFEYARGTADSPQVVQEGDVVMRLFAYGYSAAAGVVRQVAGIQAVIDGTPDSGGDTTDMPGAILFLTSSEGGAGSTERLRVGSDGGIFMYALKTGTSQAGAGAAANELWEHSTTHVIYKGI